MGNRSGVLSLPVLKHLPHRVEIREGKPVLQVVMELFCISGEIRGGGDDALGCALLFNDAVQSSDDLYADLVVSGVALALNNDEDGPDFAPVDRMHVKASVARPRR